MATKTKTTIIAPTEAEVPALTDRLAEIEREMKMLKTEKDGIEARLELYALAQKGEPLADAGREGRRVTLTGSRFSFPVLFTSDLLIKSFKSESPKHQQLRQILLGKPAETFKEEADADLQMELFFSRPNTWEVKLDDGQAFRKHCAEMLTEDKAAAFISECTQRDKYGVKKSNTVFDLKQTQNLKETEVKS